MCGPVNPQCWGAKLNYTRLLDGGAEFASLSGGSASSDLQDGGPLFEQMTLSGYIDMVKACLKIAAEAVFLLHELLHLLNYTHQPTLRIQEKFQKLFLSGRRVADWIRSDHLRSC